MQNLFVIIRTNQTTGEKVVAEIFTSDNPTAGFSKAELFNRAQEQHGTPGFTYECVAVDSL